MKSFATRTSIAAVGGLLIAGVGLAAVADPTEHGTDGVDVNVSISQLDEPGVLAMTVADDAVTLAETTSTDPALRQFEGTLPTVTVTDTRTADEIGDGFFWYVVGQASDFTGPAALGAENLGWAPFLTSDDSDGQVIAGEEVAPALDTDAAPDNVGLVDKELLAMTMDSAAVVDTGSWSAQANLLLKTPVDQTAGDYSSVLTLSLWEDTY